MMLHIGKWSVIVPITLILKLIKKDQENNKVFGAKKALKNKKALFNYKIP